MKKISIVFILSLLFISAAFSHPDIPVNGKEPYKYLSNDAQNLYSAEIYDPSSVFKSGVDYKLKLINKSLITNVEIIIEVKFKTLESLEEYTKAISNLERSFSIIRTSIEKAGYEPKFYTNESGKITSCLYSVSHN